MRFFLSDKLLVATSHGSHFLLMYKFRFVRYAVLPEDDSQTTEPEQEPHIGEHLQCWQEDPHRCQDGTNRSDNEEDDIDRFFTQQSRGNQHGTHKGQPIAHLLNGFPHQHPTCADGNLQGFAPMTAQMMLFSPTSQTAPTTPKIRRGA